MTGHRWLMWLVWFLLSACAAPAATPPAPGLFWQSGEISASQRFDLAQRSTPELIAFLRRMPKGADLHNHIGGSTFGDYLIDSARANGKRFDPELLVFTDETGPETLEIGAFEADPELVAAFRNAISMRGWYPNSVSGHDHFFQTFARVGTAGRGASEMLAEIMARNAYQNVQYLELMATTAPIEVIARFQAAYRGLDLADLEASFAPLEPLTRDPDVRAAFSRELDSWEAQAFALLEEHHDLAPERAPMVRYIPQLDRVGALDRFFAAAVLFMTAVKADDRIVAVNMVAAEDLPTARRQFDAQMRILDFLWHKMGRPPLTLHGGELSLRESPVEPMWDRIRRTIDEGHAQRIGHGTSVGWERDVVGLLEKMRSRGILVEVSLSSSEAILGIAGDDHPFRLYRDAGVPLCICTDDEAVSRSNLTMEYVKAVQRYGLAYGDVKALARNCVQHAFLPDALKAVQLAEFDARVAAFEASLAEGFRE